MRVKLHADQAVAPLLNQLIESLLEIEQQCWN